jgi:S1-C subfamily serine protease
LKEGDILIEFNGRAIQNVDDLHKQLTDQTIGAKCLLGLLRHTEKLRLEIVPEESRAFAKG